MKTFVIVARDTIENEIWIKPPLYLKVWLYLLIKAQYKDYKLLKTGQVRTSIKEIQEACSHRIGFRKEIPSIKKIRNILDWLRKPSEQLKEGVIGGLLKDTSIVTTKGTHGLVVTIDNYKGLQGFKNIEGHNDSINDSSLNGAITDTLGATHGPNINKPLNQDNNKPIKKNKTKKEALPPTPQGEDQLVISSKIVSINENKKFSNVSIDQKSVIEKRIDDLKAKFGMNRISQAYELFDMFLIIGKNRSDHKELQSIKNICNILKKKLASFEDLKTSIENYKLSKSEKIEEGYIFSCANFFGKNEEYTNYINVVIAKDPMVDFYKEMEQEIYNG